MNQNLNTSYIHIFEIFISTGPVWKMHKQSVISLKIPMNLVQALIVDIIANKKARVSTNHHVKLVFQLLLQQVDIHRRLEGILGSTSFNDQLSLWLFPLVILNRESHHVVCLFLQAVELNPHSKMQM
jgi:hypothetical protein